MKRSSVAMAAVAGLSCLTLWSCNSQDPSAQQENQKAIAEVRAKMARLEQDHTSLKTEVEELTQQVAAAAKSNKGPTADDLDKKIAAAVGKVRDQLATMEQKINSIKTAADKALAQGNERDNTPPVVRDKPVQQPPVKQPTPTVEKPKPRYDITLDKPVMGPGSR